MSLATIFRCHGALRLFVEFAFHRAGQSTSAGAVPTSKLLQIRGADKAAAQSGAVLHSAYP